MSSNNWFRRNFIQRKIVKDDGQAALLQYVGLILIATGLILLLIISLFDINYYSHLR